MNNMLEKELNEYREDLQELTNSDLLVEYKYACIEVERYRQLVRNNPDCQQPTTQAKALKWGLAKALLISLSTSGATLRQNRQVRQDTSQVLTSTDII